MDYEEFRSLNTRDQQKVSEIEHTLSIMLEKLYKAPMKSEEYHEVLSSEGKKTEIESLFDSTEIVDYRYVDSTEYIGLTERMYECIRKAGGIETSVSKIMEDVACDIDAERDIDETSIQNWMEAVEEEELDGTSQQEENSDSE